MRERSRYAAVVVFAMYLLDTLISPGVVRILFAALLLSNLRATWIASGWKPDSEESVLPPPLNASMKVGPTNFVTHFLRGSGLRPGFFTPLASADVLFNRKALGLGLREHAFYLGLVKADAMPLTGRLIPIENWVQY